MKRRLWPVMIALLLILVALLLRHEYNKPVTIEYPATLTNQDDRWEARLDGRDSRRDLDLTIVNRGPHDIFFRDFVSVRDDDFHLFNEAVFSGRPLTEAPATLARRLVHLVYRGLLPGEYDALLDRYSYDPFQALRFLGQGDSEQQSRVLALLLQSVGLEAMLFNMERHLAVAVQWDGVWHLADPTFGILFEDEENGTVPAVRELAMRPDLLKKLLEQSLGHRRATEYLSLYDWYLQQDFEARLEDAIGGAAPLPPWPLPAGAALTFDLRRPGMNEGKWRWSLQETWEKADLTWLSFQGLERRFYGLGPKDPLENGLVRLQVALPHPVTRVALTLTAHYQGQSGPLTDIYVMLPQEGAGKDALVFKDELDLSRPLQVERRFTVPVNGAITVEIRFLPGAVFLTGLDLELDFLHGHAMLPHPAGDEAELQALTAPVDPEHPEAEVTVLYRWLPRGLGGRSD